MKKLIPILLSTLLFTGCASSNNQANTYRSITMDEAVYIYDVVLGGSPVMEELVPTSYEEFVAKTGNSGIMSASDFGRARDSSAGRVAGYKDYQDYLRAMYEKYK